MKITKKHIAVAFGITIFLGVLVLAYYIWQKRKPKTVSDLEKQTLSITSSVSLPNNPSTPLIYGAQNVVYGSDGVWRLAPNTCELVESGIVDWDAIKSLTQSQKDQLFDDIGLCKSDNLPLIQP